MRLTSSRRLQAGLSLVEILVAMVISLIATLVIFQTFAVSEGVRRTSTSGGDAQQNGALALYSITRELRLAGFGINNADLLGCNVVAYDAQHSPPDVPPYTLAPALITPAASATESDSLTINYGSANLLSNPAQLMQDMASGTSIVRVSNRYGYSPADVVLIAEGGKDCSLLEITQTPETSGNTDEIHHGTGTYVDSEGKNHTVRFNKASGTPEVYTKEARVYNLGQAPVQNRYYVQNNQLLVDSTYGSPATRVVADNIVQMRVEYGKDSDGDGAVDSYDNKLPATSQEWERVAAVRIAVIARSALAEKPSVEGGACDTTTATPTWSNGKFDLSADANWNCYRYRVFETTIPLRNIIWQQLQS